MEGKDWVRDLWLKRRLCTENDGFCTENQSFWETICEGFTLHKKRIGPVMSPQFLDFQSKTRQNVGFAPDSLDFCIATQESIMGGRDLSSA